MVRYMGNLMALIYVSDLRRSVDFYTEKLGFSLVGYWDGEEKAIKPTYDEAHTPGFAMVRAGEARVGLHIWEGESAPPAGGVGLDLRVDDVDAFYRELTERGVQASEPRDFPWGQRMIFLKDPDGHPWSFYSPIGD